jgi:hypothetical protein
MSKPNVSAAAQATVELTFEEGLFAKAAQLLAEPLSETTRSRQILVLVLSLLSLGLFFGLVEAPEKISVLGMEMKTAEARTNAGARSTSLKLLSDGALRFNGIVCLALVYALIAFGVSAYRDYKDAEYLANVPHSQLNRSFREQIQLFQEKSIAAQSAVDRLHALNESNGKRRDDLLRELNRIDAEFDALQKPIQVQQAAAMAEWNRLSGEPWPAGSAANQKMAELDGQFYDLDRQRRAKLKPLSDELDAIARNPQVPALQNEALEHIKSANEVQLEQKTTRVKEVFATYFRWRKLWFPLEIVFPAFIGLLALVLPMGQVLSLIPGLR